MFPSCNSLPTNVAAHVDVVSSGWELPPVFKWLLEVSKLPQNEMLRTFNCGIGMVLVVGKDDVDIIMSSLTNSGTRGESDNPLVLGHLIPRSGEESESQVQVVGILR